MGGKFWTGLLKFWTLFIGIGALAGALMMWVDPSGRMWGMDALLPVLERRMPWGEALFSSFIFSGFALLVANGLTQYVAFFLIHGKHRLALPAALSSAVILMLWVALEWCLFGFRTMCNVYFAFGLMEALTAIVLMHGHFPDVEPKL